MAAMAVVADGSALDMSGLVGDGGGKTLSYLDLTIPVELFATMGGGSMFDLAVSNPDHESVQAFQNSFLAYTWLDGPVDACAAGFCDLYTDLVSQVPELPSWFFLLSGFGLVGAALRRRQSGPGWLPVQREFSIRVHSNLSRAHLSRPALGAVIQVQTL